MSEQLVPVAPPAGEVSEVARLPELSPQQSHQVVELVFRFFCSLRLTLANLLLLFLAMIAGTFVNPLAPKPPMLPAKAKSVIFLFMYGGPSQVDLFDPKPILNKKDGQTIDIEVRKGSVAKGKLMGTPRTFAKHCRSGVDTNYWHFCPWCTKALEA